MKFEKLNIDWNADPNDPDPKIGTNGDTLTLDFYLNYFLYEQYKEGDRGTLTFFNCHKYDFNGGGDHSFFLGQHRFSARLPWGHFYLINDTCKTDFPETTIFLNNDSNNKDLKHYIFFFRDRTFECLATDFKLKLADTSA